MSNEIKYLSYPKRLLRSELDPQGISLVHQAAILLTQIEEALCVGDERLLPILRNKLKAPKFRRVDSRLVRELAENLQK